MVVYLQILGLYRGGGLTRPGYGDAVSYVIKLVFKQEGGVGGDGGGSCCAVGGDGGEDVIRLLYCGVLCLVEEEEVGGVFGEGGVEGGEFVGVVTAKKYPVIKRVVCKVLHRGAKSRNLGGKVGKRAVSGIEFSKLGKRGGTEKY